MCACRERNVYRDKDTWNFTKSAFTPLLQPYPTIPISPPNPVLAFHPPSPPLLTHSVLLSVVSSLESFPSISPWKSSLLYFSLPTVLLGIWLPVCSISPIKTKFFQSKSYVLYCFVSAMCSTQGIPMWYIIHPDRKIILLKLSFVRQWISTTVSINKRKNSGRGCLLSNWVRIIQGTCLYW